MLSSVVISYFYVSVRFFFFFKQKTAYEMRISDWSSDVCSSDLAAISALSAPGLGVDATTAIAGLQLLQGKVPAARTIELGELFGLGVWQDSRIGGPAAINAGLNALQLASAALQLANGQNVLATTETVALPGGLATRSEAHTSELQSLMRISYAVFC